MIHSKIKSRKFWGKAVGLALAAVLALPSLAHASTPTLWTNLHWVGWSYETVGTNVRAVQQICGDEGFGSIVGSIDGLFGNNTYKGIIAYQGKFSLSQDGTVGTQTWNVMRSGLVYTYQLGIGYDVYRYKDGPSVFEYLDTGVWKYATGTYNGYPTFTTLDYVTP